MNHQPTFEVAIGLDIGTTGTKAVFCTFERDVEGNVIPGSRRCFTVFWGDNQHQVDGVLDMRCGRVGGAVFVGPEALAIEGLAIVSQLKLLACDQDRLLDDLKEAEGSVKTWLDNPKSHTGVGFGLVSEELKDASSKLNRDGAFGLLVDILKKVWTVYIIPQMRRSLGPRIETVAKYHLCFTLPSTMLPSEKNAWRKANSRGHAGRPVEPLQVLDEPPAALIGLIEQGNLQVNFRCGWAYIVFDLGGGTTVSLILTVSSDVHTNGSQDVRSFVLKSLNPLQFTDTTGTELSGCFGAELVILQLQRFLLYATNEVLGKTDVSASENQALLSRLIEAFHNFSGEEEPATIWLHSEHFVQVDAATTNRLKRSGWVLNLSKGFLGLRAYKFRQFINSCVKPAVELLYTATIHTRKATKDLPGNRDDQYPDRTGQTAIVVVGGFARNKYLRNQIRERLEKIIWPENIHFITGYRNDTVARGAALFASGICPGAILGSAHDAKFGLCDYQPSLELQGLADNTVKLVDMKPESGSFLAGDAKWLVGFPNELRIPVCWSAAVTRNRSSSALSRDHPTSHQNHFDCRDPKNKIRYAAVCGLTFGPARAEKVRRLQAEGHYDSTLINYKATMKLVDEQMLWITMVFPIDGHWECSQHCHSHSKHDKEHMTAKFGINLSEEIRFSQLESGMDDLAEARIIAPNLTWNKPHEHLISDMEPPHAQLSVMAIKNDEELPTVDHEGDVVMD